MNVETKIINHNNVDKKWHTMDDGEVETRWQGLKDEMPKPKIKPRSDFQIPKEGVPKKENLEKEK
jgi:hypothetical protein